MKEVTIIGSGVIGLCTAYYLNQQGAFVTILDQNNAEDENCSVGNAGLIVPSHFIPLAAPGVITKGLKWMLNPTSPFYIKPRFNKDLIQWVWQFYKHSTAEHVLKSGQLLHDINRLSKELYEEIDGAGHFKFEFERNGLMMLYNTDKAGEEELEIAHKAKSLGIKVESLTAHKVLEIQEIPLNVKGGVYYPDDAQLNPNVFMKKMKAHLKSKGVGFKWNTKVIGVVEEKNKIQKIKTNQGDLKVDNLVIATGSWTSELATSLRLKIPIQAGKGYSFNINQGKENLKVPSVLCEAKIAVTPFGQDLRFAGTMGIQGMSLKKNNRRIDSIKKAIPKYFSSINMDAVNASEAWAGLRPCSPDGLPFIGKGKQDNTFIATGHAMMGMSLGPITGKLLTEMITDQKQSLNIDKLSPLRYS